MSADRLTTRTLAVDPDSPEPDVIAEAAAHIRSGRLVAFPTETVYGLGANALDEAAVHRIFAAKGRPARNPIIVHVPNVVAARSLAIEWPEAAEHLAAAFWPGPLTLVLPKRSTVPDVVTGGGATVAVRVPAHSVSLALLEAAGLPIAAPSANRSSRLSPTRAEHVLKSLGGRIDLILDGGPTPGGIESTVVGLTGDEPRLLRPGIVTLSELESVIGPVAIVGGSEPGGNALPSPGMLERHYAPNVPMTVAADDGADDVRELLGQGLRVAWLRFDSAIAIRSPLLLPQPMPRDPAKYAARLYATLHFCEDAGVERIVVAAPPDDEGWSAIRDRLRRASVGLN